MPQTATFRGKTNLRSAQRLLASGCVLMLLVSNGFSQTRSGDGASAEPMATVALPSVNQLYSDLKLVFDLAGDEKGYKTLTETIDQFLIGVDTGKPGSMRVYSTPDGVRTVLSLPVKSEADYHKFLENLFDLDVKTAPAPKSSLASQVTKDVHNKLKSLKLDSHERVVFGLYDGFMRYEGGEVRIGETLEDVRMAGGGANVELTKGAGLTVHMDGKSQSPEKRREAFNKTREKLLSNLKKWEDETEGEFGHRKAITEQAFTDIGNLLTEAARAKIDVVISHEKKRGRIDAEMKADTGSALAKRIERIGHTPDEFAGVSKEGTAGWMQVNIPLDERRKESIQSVARHGRAAAKERIDDKTKSQNQEAKFEDLDDLIADIADDVAGLPEFNGFSRTWSNKGGALTTVGAVKVSDSAKVIEYLQKLRGKAGEGQSVKLKVASVDGVDIHQVASSRWQKDYPELFDDEGTVYLGTGEKAIWYALGARSLDHLKQAIPEAKRSSAKSENAFELQARLLPFAEAWDKIHSRRGKTGASEKVENVKEKIRKNRPKVADAAKRVSDLELSKLAVEAFQKGKDSVSKTVSGKGDTLTAVSDFDEGTLRFIGKALSQFVKENLED